MGRAARARPRAIAAGLRALGVGAGDRVVAYLPNIPETVAAFLGVRVASARSGRACSPDFGARSVVDRFAQIEPKVLLAVDGYRYGGKDFDRREVVARAAGARCRRSSAPCVLPYLDAGATLDGAIDWDELPRRATTPSSSSRSCRSTTRCGCSTRSGTTGLPKAIVHGQGGILLEHLKKMHLHLDAQAGDRVFWFTTTGWMMWNFLVGVLLTPASIVLYDGNPGAPGPGRAVGPRRARPGITMLRHERGVHRRVHEGRRRAGATGAT